MGNKLFRSWFNQPKVFATILLFNFIASGCVTTSLSPSAAKILSADDKMVVGCTYVGDVDGFSGWGGLATPTGIQNAKNEATEKAAALGATHILWINISGGMGPTAYGRAYICK